MTGTYVGFGAFTYSIGAAFGPIGLIAGSFIGCCVGSFDLETIRCDQRCCIEQCIRLL